MVSGDDPVCRRRPTPAATPPATATATATATPTPVPSTAPTAVASSPSASPTATATASPVHSPLEVFANSTVLKNIEAGLPDVIRVPAGQGLWDVLWGIDPVRQFLQTQGITKDALPRLNIATNTFLVTAAVIAAVVVLAVILPEAAFAALAAEVVAEATAITMAAASEALTYRAFFSLPIVLGLLQDYLKTIGWGDPHLVTLDGITYDLQAVGEFHLLQVPSYGLDVQARFAPWNGSSSVSLMTRIAFQVGDQSVELLANNSILVDGKKPAVDRDGSVRLRDGSRLAQTGTGVLFMHESPRVWWRLSIHGG